MSVALRSPGVALVVVATLLAAATGCSDGGSRPAGVGDADGQTTTTTTPPPPPSWKPLLEPSVGGRLTAVWIDPAGEQHRLVGGDILGVGVTFDGGATWERATGFASYEVNRFTAASDGTLWAGTMSGPYRSTDGGRTWQAMRNGFPPVSPDRYTAPVDEVLIDPRDRQRLLALGGSHHFDDGDVRIERRGLVWASSDGGSSWSAPTRVTDGILDGGVILPDGAVVVGAGRTGIFRREPGASRWLPVETGGRDVTDLAASPDGRRLLATYATDRDGGPGGVLASDDGGRTWSPALAGLSQARAADRLDQSRYYTVGIAPSLPSRAYTVDSGFAGAAVYRSDDGGRTWRAVLTNAGLPTRPYRAGVSARALAVDAADPDHVVVANEEYLLESRDGGLTWQEGSNNVDATSAPAAFTGRGFSGLVATAVGFDPTTPGLVFLCGFDGATVLRSTDDGRRWTRPLSPLVEWGGSYAVAADGAGVVLVILGQDGRFGGVARSADGGGTWTVLAGAGSGLPERSDAALPVKPRDVVALGPGRFALTVAGVLYRSDDAGLTWRALGRDGYGALAVAGERLYAAGAAGVVRLEGDRPIPLPGLPGGPSDEVDVAVAPGTAAADDVVLAVRFGPGGGLYRWASGSADRLADNRTLYRVAVDPFDARHLALASYDLPFHDEMISAGVIESFDGGETFTAVRDGLGMSRVAALAFDPHRRGRLLAGTVGGGFFELDRSGT